MKYKLLFETKNVPTFEDFEKSIHQYEGYSIRIIIERACQTISYSFIKGYLLTPVNQCYRFEYCKETSRILTEIIGELKPKVPLTFDTLRKANIQRLPEFKNSKGLPAHLKEDGSDWSPSDWLGAVLGELGEYANVMKKVKRGDLTFDEAKPLIEKELADVMTYLDILAFRVGVDLAKATENKFNEVSERVGCSLRIENNEVVRKEVSKPYYGFVLPTYPQAVDFAKTGTITNIKVQTTNSILNKNMTLSVNVDDEIKVSVKPKLSDKEFKTAKEACKISRQELFIKKSFASDIGGVLNEMVRWKLFRNYAEIYPLKIPRNTIDDVYSFDFQGIDDGKQYLFYHAKRIFHAKLNRSLHVMAIPQSYLFEYFSKQLGTKIVGMLINGCKDNTKLNPGDLIQFYDDRNVLYNFRLVKSSDKNVGVSLT